MEKKPSNDLPGASGRGDRIGMFERASRLLKDDGGLWEPLWVLIRVAVVFGLLALAVAVVAGGVDPGEAGVAVGIVAAVLVLAALRRADLRSISRGLQKISFAGVAIELDAKAAAAQAPQGEEEEEEETKKAVKTIYELRFLLEAKLAYVAKWLLADRVPTKEWHATPVQGQYKHSDRKSWMYVPNFATIGSLEYDDYLTTEQARTAARVLTMSETAVAVLPDPERFISEARDFVTNFRITVFERLVRKIIEDAKWNVRPTSGRVRDLIAATPQITLRVVPVLDVGGSSAMQKVQKRLDQHDLDERKRTIIVVPNGAKTEPTPPNTHPAVVWVGDLEEALKHV